MKLLVPLVIALAGLGVGVGAGVALKPAPEAEADTAACPEGDTCEPAAPDPFAPTPSAEAKPDKPAAVVAIDKPFVVPVFSDETVVAMVVASVAVEIAAGRETEVEAATPRLRDAFLAAMFRHANSGGFDGAFTAGRKMEDLRAALIVAAHAVFGEGAVSDVLITEIAKQDV